MSKSCIRQHALVLERGGIIRKIAVHGPFWGARCIGGVPHRSLADGVQDAAGAPGGSGGMHSQRLCGTIAFELPLRFL
jgi:hypothetical protein